MTLQDTFFNILFFKHHRQLENHFEVRSRELQLKHQSKHNQKAIKKMAVTMDFSLSLRISSVFILFVASVAGMFLQ